MYGVTRAERSEAKREKGKVVTKQRFSLGFPVKLLLFYQFCIDFVWEKECFRCLCLIKLTMAFFSGVKAGC